MQARLTDVTLTAQTIGDPYNQNVPYEAAVLHSPVAVLAYPGTEPSKLYDVQGFNGQPAVFATMGLDLCGYERVSGAEEQAAAILDLVGAATTRAGDRRG